jgi:prevent-host-death family protein
MYTYNVTNDESKLHSLLHEVNQTHMPVQIIDQGAAAVILSADDWRAIEETIYINSVHGLADSIRAASKEPIADCLLADEADW